MYKYNNYFLIILAVASIGSLILFDNLESAYALSISTFANNGDSANFIARCGDTVITIDNSAADINFFSASTGALLSGLATGGGSDISCSADGTRAFSYNPTTGTLQEIDVINQALLRTLATGCDASRFYPTNGLTFVCGTTTATDQVKIISLASMSITYTSSTLDAGGNACDNIGTLSYNTATDTLFAGCIATNTLVAVVDFSVSGTPDASVATTHVAAFSMAFNPVDSRVMTCATTQMELFSWSGSAFASLATDTTGICGTQFSAVVYAQTPQWFIIDNSSTENLVFFDAENGDFIINVSFPTAFATNSGLMFYSTSAVYTATGTGTNWYVLDTAGIPFGTGGSGSGGGTGIDCTLPENANILTCRLGGDGSLGGAGTFIVGSVNGTTGLVPIMCSVGLVDCDANPDVATNGAGYLIVGIAIAVWVGVMWVASRGDLSSIPTFLWFIGALLIVGAFTVAGVIDVVFFIVTIIFVCALAAAKAKGLLGGGF